MSKYARCAKCHGFFNKNIEILDCPACSYRSARCEKCGGFDGVWRSIRAHWNFFRGRRGEDGGHAERLREWFSGLLNDAHADKPKKSRVFRRDGKMRAA